MKKLLFFLVAVCSIITASAQQRPQFGEKPKLVVGIVVDQMRWD